MTIVLDASGAAEILLHNNKAEIFFNKIKEAPRVIAPNLFVSELTNVFWKYNKAKKKTYTECIKLIQDGINYIDEFIDGNDLWQEALSEGIKYNHPIYDMFYMVCAKREDAILLTCDTDLIDICRKNGVEVCL